MEMDREREKILKFVKTGLVVLSVLLVCSCLYHFLSGMISVSNNAGKKELPIYCVDREDNKVGLSFDAAWGNDDTAELLDILKNNEVKATFFMTGGWIERYPDDVKAIAAAGHDLANHSENHKQMSRLSKEQCVEELMKPHEKVKELTGVEMSLFRPPYGDYNNTLLEATKESGYDCIQWDVELSQTDWRYGG